jgi:solute carrier family 25 phosphate transporter 23/24/25/41
MDAAQSIDALPDGRAVVVGGVGREGPERKRRRTGEAASRQTAASSEAKPQQQPEDINDAENHSSSTADGATDDRRIKRKLYTLTEFVPDPGYFVAGAIAGGVSRTATAPLDRLKVYLLVNTKSEAETAVTALKSGRPMNAVKNAARPLGDAVRDLYRAGGLRGFFAGKKFPHHSPGMMHKY